MDLFACSYCGTQQVVQRRGGTVALKLVSDAIARVQVGTDRTASELAIRRLKDEILAIESARFSLYQAAPQAERSRTGAVSYFIIGFIISVGLAVMIEVKFGLAGESGKKLGEVCYVGLAITVIISIARAMANASERRKEYAEIAKCSRDLDVRIAAKELEIDRYRAIVDNPRDDKD